MHLRPYVERDAAGTAEIFRLAVRELTHDDYDLTQISARPFFESHGFVILAEQAPARNGITLPNFHMRRAL